MEIIWRSFIHFFLTMLNRTTTFVDQDAYLNNIKRMRIILINDYGRGCNSAEVQTQCSRTCSVASESVSTCDVDADLAEFEYPETDEYEESQSGSNSNPESHGTQVSGESSSTGISNGSHGSQSKI